MYRLQTIDFDTSEEKASKMESKNIKDMNDILKIYKNNENNYSEGKVNIYSNSLKYIETVIFIILSF